MEILCVKSKYSVDRHSHGFMLWRAKVLVAKWNPMNSINFLFDRVIKSIWREEEKKKPEFRKYYCHFISLWLSFIEWIVQMTIHICRLPRRLIALIAGWTFFVVEYESRSILLDRKKYAPFVRKWNLFKVLWNQFHCYELIIGPCKAKTFCVDSAQPRVKSAKKKRKTETLAKIWFNRTN